MEILALPGFQEPFNAISHLLGAGALAGWSVVLLHRARGDTLRVAFLAVFALASVLLLSMSGVYHMLHEGGRARAVLGRLDQAAIFGLIAGTHTPLQGLFFRGWARWGVLALVWLVAATGSTLFSIYYDHLPRGLETGVFLLLGWLAGAAGLIVWRRLGTRAAALLIVGGVVYSVGALLLALDWPVLVPGVFGAHELWHVAVLVALALHWRFFLGHAQQPMDA